jgi:hypothetical protein
VPASILSSVFLDLMCHLLAGIEYRACLQCQKFLQFLQCLNCLQCLKCVHMIAVLAVCVHVVVRPPCTQRMCIPYVSNASRDSNTASNAI